MPKNAYKSILLYSSVQLTFIGKKVHIINKTHVRARIICVFQFFILILQRILDLI